MLRPRERRVILEAGCRAADRRAWHAPARGIDRFNLGGESEIRALARDGTRLVPCTGTHHQRTKRTCCDRSGSLQGSSEFTSGPRTEDRGPRAAEAKSPLPDKRRLLSHDPDAPATCAAAVEGDTVPVRRPAILLGRGIVQHAAHRSAPHVEQPDAVTSDLEDDLAAVG